MKYFELFNTFSEDEKLAYFGGLIDAEGCLKLCKYGEKHRPSLVLGSTDKETILLFANYFNLKWVERTSPSKTSNPKHSRQYQTKAACQIAYQVIKTLYPFLSVKKEDAEVCLAVYDDRKQCPVCSQRLAPTRRSGSVYCSKKCQKGRKQNA